MHSKQSTPLATPSSTAPQNSIANIIKKCVTLLQICVSSKLQLKQVHAFSIKHGVPLSNPDFGKHLIYGIVTLSASMSYAHKIFSFIQDPNIFTWNTMIRGYAESENPSPASELYNKMHYSSIKPDTHTYPFLLKAIAKLADVKLGEMIHSVAVRNGFESLLFVQNGLVHMYGRPNEALTLLREMCFEGVSPDGFTMVSLFSACAELGALALGRRAHVYMSKIGLSENINVNNALLDFYAKCGSIREAKKVFDDMEERNMVSWSSLIVGLAVNGFGKEALECFKEMEREGFMPGEATFVGVLYACSHCGMVDEGYNYFRRMTNEYKIVPKIEHFGCMVDLLGRAGLVKEAYEYIQNMPMLPSAVIWRTLLGACTTHGHSGLADIARTKLLQLEPKHSGDFVLLSNLYASKQRWLDVQRVRRTMVGERVKKIPGHSFVELGNHVHEFYMGDRSHPQNEEIYAMLVEITKKLKQEGYVPRTENVLMDIEEEEKENALSYHSEKIAIAFMLINTPPRTPIRVIKNLRVCADCHLVIKLISKVFNREIVVRDRSRFHHFKDGDCSCRDYW
ncbi:hypothetical protein Pint_11042 [Pistacia integerrima]|uniref:Uncharacterized protein n=1 Tax=Pistacia integerrima TaxID=434235 RepID=A0ACC0XLU2_9ROSI|nr:hypothetical protein Pint_11042 [Pistacia integerrima]